MPAFPPVIDLTSLTAADGFIIQGDVSGDRAGWSVSSAGDVNGDGIDDLIVGGYVVFGTRAGFGVDVGGRQVIDLTSLTASQGFIIQGDTVEDGAIWSVSSAGDVNGDGIDDLIVGAPEGDDGGDYAGQAYVVFGTRAGFGADVGGRQVIDLSNLTAALGFIIQGDSSGDQAGGSVSSAGDVNGDGIDDLIVGGPSGDDGGYNAGEAYVVFGTRAGFGADVGGRQVIDLTSLTASQGFIIQGDTGGDYAGWSVSSAGDVNGDGIDDLIVGAPLGDDDGGHNGGEAYVVFGTRAGFGVDVGGRRVIDLTSLTAAQGFIIQGDAEEDRAGWSVSSAGDVNGDGIDDLIVGAPYGDDGGDYAGQAYVVFGIRAGFGVDVGGRRVIDLASLTAALGFIIQGDAESDRAGWSVSSGGDVNGDGIDDLIVGAPRGEDGGYNAGEAYVVFGTRAGFGADVGGRQVIDLTSLTASQGLIIQGDTGGDYAGWSVSSAGDVNGDGIDDLIVGAPLGGDGGSQAGEAYVIYGRRVGASANSPPTEHFNTGITLDEGATATITALALDYDDAEQADSAITYTVTSAATNGSVRLAGVTLGVGGTFTQADINAGLLSYRHDGGETTSASFGFSVSDGAGETVTGRSFAFAITPVNDPATIAGTATGNVAEDGTQVATGTLTVTDPDAGDAALQPRVAGTAGANGYGSFEILANGQWSYTLDNANAAVQALPAGGTLTDSISAVSKDGTASQPITVTIHGTNDAPTLLGSTDAFGTVTELPDHAPNENVATLSDSGTIFFSDRDLTDMHSSSWTAQSGGYLGSFTLGAVNQGADNVGWSFSVSDAALNSLGFGAVVKQYYDVTIDDGHGGTVTQTVEVDLHGTNDAAILTSANFIVPQGPAPVSASGDLDITDEDDPALFVVQSNTAGHYGHFSIDADGNWSYLADAAYILGPNEVLSEVFTVLAVDGTPTTVAVTIQGIDQPGAAHDDLFTTNESSVIGAGRNLFADNGSGPDSDPDSALAIGAVNGNPANVGHSLLLASGARVIVNSNGTFSYDTNGAWTGLSGLMGASNHFGHDSFTYTLAGGDTATVYMNIVGEVTPGDISWGSGANDDIIGSSANDTIRLDQDGSDHATGEGGNDGFYFGSRLDHGDSVDGGEGNDTVALQGNTNVALGDISNVEVIALLSGSNAAYGDTGNNRYDYDITTNNGNVAAGQTLTVIGTALLPGEDLRFDGSAETDGNFRIFAGQGVDDLTGGTGNDGFFFGADGNLNGADHVDGGAGTDSIALRGKYVGANAVVFQDGSFSNVEVLAMLSGHSNEYGGVIVPGGYDYDITMANGNVAGGRTFDVSATGLKADESLRFDGRLETDAFFRIFSGAGNDTLYGGGQNDMLYGGLGKDWMEGGPGADTYIFRSAAESTGIGHDTISGFDYTADRIDAPGGGGRSFSQSATGNLSLGSFDADLASGLSGLLGAGQAALFTASGGSLAGHIFAVIDVNGVAGYQAGEDLVIELLNPVLPIDPMAGVVA